MIYFNQIKDTRYLVQICLNENLSFDLQIMIFFKYYDSGKIEIPLLLDRKHIHSIMLNGKNQPLCSIGGLEFPLSTKYLNSFSDNIINLKYFGKLDHQVLIISNTFKELNKPCVIPSYTQLSLPHFNYYTSTFKYRIIATIPKSFGVIYDEKPFENVFLKGKNILCYESLNEKISKKIKFIIKQKD